MVKKRGLVDFLIGRFYQDQDQDYVFDLELIFYDLYDVFKIKEGENFLRSRSPFFKISVKLF